MILIAVDLVAPPHCTDSVPRNVGAATAVVAKTFAAVQGHPLVYDGDPIMFVPEEMLWAAVRVLGVMPSFGSSVAFVFPGDSTGLEAVPGIWETGCKE